MKRVLLSVIALFAIVASVKAAKPYTATDASLERYNVPEWYQDAKLGYWVHWGVYSVPAFAGDHAAEWYGRWMYVVDDNSGAEKGAGYEKKGLKTAKHHRETYGDPSEFGYKDFIPMWKAEKFDANEWADLFAAGGAKFFNMMAMHHDNYPLWDSETVPLNSVNSGPKRDFVGEMAKAIRDRGLRFGVSNHSAWNSTFFQYNHYNKIDADTSPIYGNEVVDAIDIAQWWARSTELVEKYHPDLVWYDWCWNRLPYDKQLRMNFCSWYYNKAADWGMASESSPEVVVAYKGRNRLPDGSAVLDLERSGMSEVYPYVWMNDTSLGLHSWSYAADEEYRSPNQVIDMLLDIVSKNGILLLNIGPKADGTIPDVAQESIKQTGDWLAINGEGVYATRAWTIYGEGPTQPGSSMDGDHVEYTNKDIRFTRSKDNKTLFIHVLGYSKLLDIEILKRSNIDLSTISNVTLLGVDSTIKYAQSAKSFAIKMPKGVDSASPAFTFKVEFDGEIPSIAVAE